MTRGWLKALQQSDRMCGLFGVGARRMKQVSTLLGACFRPRLAFVELGIYKGSKQPQKEQVIRLPVSKGFNGAAEENQHGVARDERHE
eukprot:CAMPEP_0171524234 /NCGR_PEP_ID=MMETSP0959-20130129/8930_1 /TAXON_ID=87120 /ORGANISM="Aurantiochytrium limacinum, Strain ATCCMYA-1381" /LENGTH=87 /DNA_ID=CAMNT_0012064935 /DNA_START=265 /DNA_END=528 /DNA_ORIENTATION=+